MPNWLAAIGRARPAIQQTLTDIEERPRREEAWQWKREEAESERTMRPLRERATTAQVAVSEEQARKVKEQAEFESRGWDPDIDPIFQKWLPEDQGKAKEQLSKMIPPNPQTGKWTQGDRRRAMETIQQDAGMLATVTQFNVNAIKSNIQTISKKLADAEEKGKQEDIQKYRVQLKQSTDQHDIELGKFDKITTAFEIRGILGQIDESKMPESVKESIQALGKAGDVVGIRDLLKEYVKSSVKPAPKTYVKGEVTSKGIPLSIDQTTGTRYAPGGIEYDPRIHGEIPGKGRQLTEVERDPDAHAFSKALEDARKTEQTPLFMEKLSEAEQQRAEARLRQKAKSNYLARKGSPKKFDQFWKQEVYGAERMDAADISKLKEFDNPDQAISHVERSFRANMISTEMRDQALTLINQNRKTWGKWRVSELSKEPP